MKKDNVDLNKWKRENGIKQFTGKLTEADCGKAVELIFYDIDKGGFYLEQGFILRYFSDFDLGDFDVYLPSRPKGDYPLHPVDNFMISRLGKDVKFNLEF